MTEPEKIISEIEPGRVDRLWWMLFIMSKSGGTSDASDNKWCWLNAFWGDFEDADGGDTFNLAIDLGLLRCTHDTSFDISTAWLTDAGKALVAYFDKLPSASLIEERDRLREENRRLRNKVSARALTDQQLVDESEWLTTVMAGGFGEGGGSPGEWHYERADEIDREQRRRQLQSQIAALQGDGL